MGCLLINNSLISLAWHEIGDSGISFFDALWTWIVLDNCETRIVSVFFSLKCEHTLVKKQNLQLIRPTYVFFYEKQCIYRGRRVCWWNFLITINEILDVSISFLNDHLEETLGPTKNRRKSLKMYQSHTGKCFILILNHGYVMTWFCKSFPIKSKITCVIMDQ